MRASAPIPLVAAVLLAGCGSSADTNATTKTERCIDRLLSHARETGDEEAARRYAERTYCAPFVRKGWVYDDGALSIEAQKWLDKGARCASASEGTTVRTVPCERVSPDGTINCALLRHVRREEARNYVAELRRERSDVRCDDGTPLAELGVP